MSPSPVGPNSSNGPSQEPVVAPENLLNKKIEAALGGVLVSQSATPLVEDYLRAEGLTALPIAARDLCSMIEGKGMVAELQYCKSKVFDYPVPVVTVRSIGGGYGVPSVNLVWDPVIPIEREVNGKSQAKQVITGEECSESEGVFSPRVLQVETFSHDAPVRIILIPSENENTSVQAMPIFSEKALAEAREHAAQCVITQEFDSYSFVLNEVIIPKVVERIREDSGFFGRRETPELADEGSDPQGAFYELLTFVPMRESTEELRFKGAVIEDGLSLKMRLIAI